MVPGEIVERLAGGESRIRVSRQHRALTIEALAARALAPVENEGGESA